MFSRIVFYTLCISVGAAGCAPDAVSAADNVGANASSAAVAAGASLAAGASRDALSRSAVQRTAADAAWQFLLAPDLDGLTGMPWTEFDFEYEPIPSAVAGGPARSIDVFYSSVAGGTAESIRIACNTVAGGSARSSAHYRSPSDRRRAPRLGFDAAQRWRTQCRVW